MVRRHKKPGATKNEQRRYHVIGSPLLAVWTRLELATSCVTGRHSNQLNYHTVFFSSTCLSQMQCKDSAFFLSSKKYGKSFIFFFDFLSLAEDREMHAPVAPTLDKMGF